MPVHGMATIIRRRKKRWQLVHFPKFLARKNVNNAHKDVQKSSTIFNLAYTMSLAQGQMFQK